MSIIRTPPGGAVSTQGYLDNSGVTASFGTALSPSRINYDLGLYAHGDTTWTTVATGFTVNGNILRQTSGGNLSAHCRTNTDISGKKCYVEFKMGPSYGQGPIGVARTNSTTATTWLGQDATAIGWFKTGEFYKNGAQASFYSPQPGPGDVLGIAWDDTGGLGLIAYAVNNTWVDMSGAGTGTNPVTGAGMVDTRTSGLLSGAVMFGAAGFFNLDEFTLRTLLSEFAYTPPSGYTALDPSTAVNLTPLAGAIALSGGTPVITAPGLNPTAAAITITGVAPVITVPGLLPGAGAISLTGVAPVIAVPGLKPGAAAISLTAGTPTIQLGLAPLAGAITLSFGTPSLQLGLTPGAGAITLSVGTPVAAVPGLIPGAGAISLTGGTPVVAQGLVPIAAAITLSFGTPVITVPGLKPGAAAITLTGGTPSLQTGLNPGAGAISLSGGTPTIQLGLTPTATTVSLSGGTPVITVPGLNPGAGSIALTGGTPSLQTGLTPGTATITLGGGTPTVALGLIPAAGTITLTGGTPVVDNGSANINLTPQAGAITLSGGTPTVTVSDNKNILPGAGTITLDPGTPVVTGATTFIDPQPGTITLVPGTPTITGSEPPAVSSGGGGIPRNLLPMPLSRRASSRRRKGEPGPEPSPPPVPGALQDAALDVFRVPVPDLPLADVEAAQEALDAAQAALQALEDDDEDAFLLMVT